MSKYLASDYLQNRTDEDKISENKHYEQMEKIVQGKSQDLIKRLEFEPGTLSIFQGNLFFINTLVFYSTFELEYELNSFLLKLK